MIEYIRGEIISSGNDYIIVEHNQIGYKILTSSQSIDFFNNSEGDSAQIIIYTELIVREDAMMLCGFSTKFERRIFKLLTSVSGIGMKVALSALSSIGAESIIFAISCGDDKSLTKIPGVGAKTAKRIILELKDKVGDIDLNTSIAYNSGEISVNISSNKNYTQAIDALLSLGYSYEESQKSFSNIDKQTLETANVETLISIALKNIIQ